MNFKNVLLLLLICVFMSNGVNSQNPEKDYSLAKSGKKIYGVYMFIYAEPYYSYDYIATIRLKNNEIGFSESNLQRIVIKAKKKYSYFNGMIFKNDDFTEVDLIKFQNLKVSRGGFSIGDNVSFIMGEQIFYGNVVELDGESSEAKISYPNIYGKNLIESISFNKLTHISDEDFKIKTEEFKKTILKYKFKNGEKVSWIKNNETYIGEVISVNNERHKAKVRTVNIYDEEVISTIKVLKLIKMSDEEYKRRLEPLRKKILKYKFIEGEKVKWIDLNNSYIGEIISLNNDFHLASIKYMNKYGEDKVKKITFRELIKISDEEFNKTLSDKKIEVKKHQFKIGDRVKWVKSDFKSKTKIQYIGEIIDLKGSIHKATVKYINIEGVEETDNINYLDLLKSK